MNFLKKIYILLLSLSYICVSAQSITDEVLLTDSDLPLIIINTGGQIIPDEPEIIAHMGIIDHEGGGKII